MKTLASAWQRRRGAFNHDWLKNRFLPALAKGLNLLDGHLEDPDFEAAFPDTVLPQWERHRPEAAALLADFETRMSPRQFLGDGPFDFSLPSHAWLAEVVHGLWSSRLAVPSMRDKALLALAEGDRTYAQLRDALPRGGGVHGCRPQLAAFRDACQQLGRAIEVLPCEVLVT